MIYLYRKYVLLLFITNNNNSIYIFSSKKYNELKKEKKYNIFNINNVIYFILSYVLLTILFFIFESKNIKK